MMYFRKMLYLPYLIAVFIAILPSINAASPPVQMNEEGKVPVLKRIQIDGLTESEIKTKLGLV